MASVFARSGRLHIPGFLVPEAADALYRTLEAERLWVCSTIGKGVVADVPVEALYALSEEEQACFITLAHAEAAEGFHYLFDTVRILGFQDRDAPLAPGYRALARFLNSPAFLDFVRVLTGDDRPAFVDAQATRYRPGHYLTEHNDTHPRNSRLYAYVLNLTPFWRPDWGGLLNFIDEDGHLAEAYKPSFNALNIFRVPQQHSVGFVAPFAQGSRLSVTGWIHDRLPDPVSSST